MVRDKVTVMVIEAVDKRKDHVTHIPYEHTDSLAMGFILFQPIVATWPLNLKGGTEHFYETLTNNKN